MSPNCKFWSAVKLLTWYRPAYVITMIADALGPNKRQVIRNHHADSAMTTMSHEPYCAILVFCYSQQTTYIWESSGGRQPFGFFIIAGFTFSGHYHTLCLGPRYQSRIHFLRTLSNPMPGTQVPVQDSLSQGIIMPDAWDPGTSPGFTFSGHYHALCLGPRYQSRIHFLRALSHPMPGTQVPVQDSLSQGIIMPDVWDQGTSPGFITPYAWDPGSNPVITSMPALPGPQIYNTSHTYIHPWDIIQGSA